MGGHLPKSTLNPPTGVDEEFEEKALAVLTGLFGPPLIFGGGAALIYLCSAIEPDLAGGIASSLVVAGVLAIVGCILKEAPDRIRDAFLASIVLWVGGLSILIGSAHVYRWIYPREEAVAPSAPTPPPQVQSSSPPKQILRDLRQQFFGADGQYQQHTPGRFTPKDLTRLRSILSGLESIDDPSVKDQTFATLFAGDLRRLNEAGLPKEQELEIRLEVYQRWARKVRQRTASEIAVTAFAASPVEYLPAHHLAVILASRVPETHP